MPKIRLTSNPTGQFRLEVIYSRAERAKWRRRRRELRDQASDIIHEVIVRRGIRVSRAGDELVVIDGPPDMSEVDLDFIRANKATIIDFLRRTEPPYPRW